MEENMKLGSLAPGVPGRYPAIRAGECRGSGPPPPLYLDTPPAQRHNQERSVAQEKQLTLGSARGQSASNPQPSDI